MSKRAKRFFRRAAGAMVGLCLGWYLAGAMLEQSPGSAALAAEKPAAGHKEGDGRDHDKNPAAALTPKAGDRTWFGGVVTAAVLLFAAAALLGPFILKFKTPDPPDPADHAHDDHAHDAHAHDAHGGHVGGAGHSQGHGGH